MNPQYPARVSKQTYQQLHLVATDMSVSIESVVEIAVQSWATFPEDERKVILEEYFFLEGGGIAKVIEITITKRCKALLSKCHVGEWSKIQAISGILQWFVRLSYDKQKLFISAGGVDHFARIVEMIQQHKDQSGYQQLLAKLHDWLARELKLKNKDQLLLDEVFMTMGKPHWPHSSSSVVQKDENDGSSETKKLSPNSGAA